jgi:hypothetical protein
MYKLMIFHTIQSLYDFGNTQDMPKGVNSFLSSTESNGHILDVYTSKLMECRVRDILVEAKAYLETIAEDDPYLLESLGSLCGQMDAFLPAGSLQEDDESKKDLGSPKLKSTVVEDVSGGTEPGVVVAPVPVLPTDLLSVKSLIGAAKAAVPSISVGEAHKLVAKGALFIDVRTPSEVAKSGKAIDAKNVPRGFLEFKAGQNIFKSAALNVAFITCY